MLQLTTNTYLLRPKALSDARSETSTESDEPVESHDVGLTPSSGKGCSKAKSSLCKNFAEKGYCPYGSKCQFAHGPQELRINMDTNRSYKTKGCHSFEKKGFCCYGDRCNFIHQLAGPSDSGRKWKAIHANHRDTLRTLHINSSSRLLSLLGLNDPL